MCAADDGAGIGIIRPGGAAVRIADLTAIGEGRCSATWDPAETVDDVRLWPDGGYELVVVDAMGAELSDRVLVNVAALATAVDRLQADYEAGLVSAEDLGLGLLAGLTRPEELPERYAGAERETPSAAGLVAALMAGGALSPEAVRLLTLTGDVEALDGLPATAGFQGSPGEGVDSVTQGGYSENCGLEFRFLDESFLCAARSEHFWVFYHPGEVGPDAQGGIGSEFVERIVVSLERARAVYAEEGFAVPTLEPLVFLSPAMPSGTGISLPFMRDGGGGSVLPVILMSSDWTDNSEGAPRVPEYLPHHEYFHQVQYEYFPAAAWLTRPFDSPYWWMEATAEWGAHLVQKSRFDFTHRGAYSRQLDKFLDRSRHFYDVGSVASSGGPEYGAFVLAEYLEEEHGGPEAIARTWQHIGRLPFGRSPAGAIEDVIIESGDSYADSIHRFREWTYPLERVQGRDVGFDGEDARLDGFWREELEPGYRPPHTVVQVSSDVREVSGAVSLSAGGAEYVEISGPLGPVGELEIEVSSPTGHEFRASVIDQVDEFPSLCPYYPSRAAEPPGVGSAPGQAVISGVIDTPPSAVVGGDSCGNAVLVITNTTPMPAPRIAGLEAGAGDFAWSVTFRPLGAQLLEGMLSAGVTHGGTFGYEFESVVAGALREPALWDGWGVSEGAVSGGVESYYRYRAEFLGDLRPESFVFSDDSAISVTRLGTLEITHEIGPSSDPRMWQVDVTVARLPGTPPTGQPVVYRRAMAWWDRYSTYFTWARTPGGGDGSVLALVGSRWDPVPPAQGGGTRGYVDRVGPLNNPAGTIDLDLGHVTEGSPERFTLYFGMAPTPAAAVASVLGVGGDGYSLVESSRTQYTAVFAWREG